MNLIALASAVATFSAKFCNELEKGKSVVSSPLSAEFVLALLALGTSEPAHAELLTALGIPDDDSIRSLFSNVSSKLNSLMGVTLNVANKVYINEGPYDLLPELKQDAIKVFDAEFEKVDFGKSAAAAALINGWVEGKTNDKIKDLLSADSLDSDTCLVLVNAIYFRGAWKLPFNPRNTMNRSFRLNMNSTVEVPMMQREGKYRYSRSEELQAKLLELPYLGGDSSMIVILPNDIEGLNALLDKLAGGYDLMSEFERMRSVKIQVTLPKFNIETEIDLTELLPKLGIKAILDRKFSGLTKILNVKKNIYISKAVQKAFIEVKEEGTEAAVATAVGVKVMKRATKSFRADRPFLYLLLSDECAPFFVGVYHA